MTVRGMLRHSSGEDTVLIIGGIGDALVGDRIIAPLCGESEIGMEGYRSEDVRRRLR